jgi:hypothetical protein
MAIYETETNYLRSKVEVLTTAIDYFSKLILEVEQDIGKPDIYGAYDEVMEQLENGRICLKGKLFEAQENLKKLSSIQ